MKSTLSRSLNIATWVVACLFTLVPVITGKSVEQITGNIIAMLFWMAVYYLFFLYIAPEFLLMKKLVMFFAVSLIVVLILPFFGYTLLFLSRAMFKGDFANLYDGYSIQVHLSGFKAMALAGVYGSFFRLIADHFKE